MDHRSMTIGEIAKQTGLTTQAIRYYEQEGLVPKPERTHTGYRMYRAEALVRLNFIRTARTLGFALDEIKEILRMAAAGRAPCSRVREMLANKLEELNRRIAELQRFREELRIFLRELSKIPDQADTSRRICVLIETASNLFPLHKPGKGDKKIAERAGRSSLAVGPNVGYRKSA